MYLACSKFWDSNIVWLNFKYHESYNKVYLLCLSIPKLHYIIWVENYIISFIYYIKLPIKNSSLKLRITFLLIIFFIFLILKYVFGLQNVDLKSKSYRKIWLIPFKTIEFSSLNFKLTYILDSYSLW